jgi:hypothetical protein
MVNRSFFLFLILICTPVLQSRFCSAQADDSTSRVGIGIKVSLLGAGVEVATPITGHSNLRAGFNAFSYDRTFHSDGIAYAGQLRFRSVEAHYDWFPFGGAFHVSPGVLAYNGNQFTANASVPGSQTFTLNHVTYASDPSDPVGGNGKVDFNKAGPMITVGWGNLLPRNHRRFSCSLRSGRDLRGCAKGGSKPEWKRLRCERCELPRY